MPDVTAHAEGAPCWFELATTDQNGAKQFYTEMFGWSVTDSPIGHGEFYSMFRKDGREVGAAYTLFAELRSQGIPPHWMVYFSTANLNETAGKVAGLGGTLIKGPFDVMEYGRMAIVRDPTGAVFSLWEPKQHIGVKVFGELNTVCWTELITPDPDAAKKFYTALLGWTTHPSQGMETYIEFSAGGNPSGGIMPMPEQFGGMPPFWGIYFRVEDSDAMAEKVKAAGGAIKGGPFDVPQAGRLAMLNDPQGAVFSIIKLNM